MTRVKLVSIRRFLIFTKGKSFNCFGGNIPPQNNDGSGFEQKISLFKLFLSILWLKRSESSEFELLIMNTWIQMARTSFFHMVLRKFIENTNNKPIFSQSIFFTNMNISFFSLCCDLVSVHRQKGQWNQKQCVLARPFSCFLFHSLRVVGMFFNIYS